MKKWPGSRIWKNLAALGCLAVCLWRAGSTAAGWARENGAETLLYAAGWSGASAEAPDPGEAEASASPGTSVSEVPNPPRASQTAEPEDDPVLEEDGVVPFHEDELPGAAATPDPDRASAPVEELFIEGGEKVADFFVKDTTGSGTDLSAQLEEEPAVHLKGDGRVEILIYHTHTSEAYSKSYTGFYYTDMETRTQNRDMSVVAVGEELKAALEAEGFGVVHDATVNDAMYNGSYSRSWEVIQKNLETYPDIQVTIDLHRDSMTTDSGTKYKPTVTIGGRKAAQIMILAGCDANGEWGDFPNWEENLRLDLRVQQKAQELYPGLARPMSFSNNKYNMNATPGSMLVEVGTEVNTVSEAKYSGRLLGEVLAEVFAETAE